MTRASYSDDQRNFIAQALVKRDEWLNFCASSQWEVTDNNKKDDITISQCMSSHNIPSMKSSGVINNSLMQVFATLHDSRYRTIYDGNIEVAEVISKVAANSYMIYQKTKAMLMVSSRDLVLSHHVCRVQHDTLCPNGGLLILAFTPSPEKDELRPITKNAIRAHCYVSIIRFSENFLLYLFANFCGDICFVQLGGWLLEEISPNQTKATLMLELDLKGGLANMIIKKALKMQGDQLKPLRTTITKYLKENPHCPYI